MKRKTAPKRHHENCCTWHCLPTKPLKGPEQAGAAQLELGEVQEAPVLPWAQHNLRKAVGLLLPGPCNTSHLQLITSVFVSNLMETELKINRCKPHSGWGVGLLGAGWTGRPSSSPRQAEQPKRCLALRGILHLAGHFSQPVVWNFLCFCLLPSITSVVMVQEKWQKALPTGSANISALYTLHSMAAFTKSDFTKCLFYFKGTSWEALGLLLGSVVLPQGSQCPVPGVAGWWQWPLCLQGLDPITFLSLSCRKWTPTLLLLTA